MLYWAKGEENRGALELGVILGVLVVPLATIASVNVAALEVVAEVAVVCCEDELTKVC